MSEIFSIDGINDTPFAVIKQGDTSPIIEYTLPIYESGSAVLDGASVRFLMGKTPENNKVTQMAVVADVDGIVRYSWYADDTDEVGAYMAEFEVTFGDGSKGTFPADGYIRLNVVPDLGNGSGVSEPPEAPVSGGYCLTFTSRADAVLGDTGTHLYIVVGGLPYVYDATGTALTTGDGRTWSPAGKAYLRHWGAVGDMSVSDALAFQAAINWISEQEHRDRLCVDMHMPAFPTQEPDTMYFTADDSVRPASIVTCYIVRSGVTIELMAGVSVTKTDQTVSVFGFLESTRSGIIGVGGKAHILGATALEGGAPGISHYIRDYSASPDGPGNTEIDLQNLRIAFHGGYGIQQNWGNLTHSRVMHVRIEDVGADGIDNKVRLGDFPETDSTGMVYYDIDVERHGRRTTMSGSAGLDLRGHAQVSNVRVRDFAGGGPGGIGSENVGIRFLGGTYDEDDLVVRRDMEWGTLSHFLIDSGDPSDDTTRGLAMLGATGCSAVAGAVLNCDTGAIISNLGASGRGVARGACTLSGVKVEGSRGKAFDVKQEYTQLIGCTAFGASNLFDVDNGNLSAGQTVFVNARPFDVATVEVYKNDTLLTETTDYTVDSDTQITLVIPVSSPDVLAIITPTAFGFSADAEGVIVSGVAKNCSTVKSATAAAIDSVKWDVVSDSDATVQATVIGTYPLVRVVGPDENYDFDIRPKGDGSVVLRNSFARIAVMSGVADAVNYLIFKQAVTGENVTISADGTDADVGIDYKVSTNSEHSFFVGATERMTITASGLKWNGTKVLGAQQPALTDPDGTNDQAVLTQIVSSLRAHGLNTT